MAGHRRKRSLEPPEDGGGSARRTAPPLGASARALGPAAGWRKGADSGRSENQGTRIGRRRHVETPSRLSASVLCQQEWFLPRVREAKSSGIIAELMCLPALSLTHERRTLCCRCMTSLLASCR